MCRCCYVSCTHYLYYFESALMRRERLATSHRRVHLLEVNFCFKPISHFPFFFFMLPLCESRNLRSNNIMNIDPDFFERLPTLLLLYENPPYLLNHLRAKMPEYMLLRLDCCQISLGRRLTVDLLALLT